MLHYIHYNQTLKSWSKYIWRQSNIA